MAIFGIVMAVIGLAMVAGMNEDYKPRKQPLLIRLIDWLEKHETK
ncbi:hypothetical protein [Paenibacillus oryzisoli]|nr:hypothetical protein [Paenibacillus oryzisoli]